MSSWTSFYAMIVMCMQNITSGSYSSTTRDDIAYIISMIKNSTHLWLLKRGDAHEEIELDNITLKSLFIVGQKKKRTFGVTTWNKLGIDYYTNAHDK